jgi:hypothetical protein
MNMTDRINVSGMYKDRIAVGNPAPPSVAVSIDLKKVMIDTAESADKRITHPVVFLDSIVFIAVFLYPSFFIYMYARKSVMKKTLPRRYNHTSISVFMSGYFLVTYSYTTISTLTIMPDIMDSDTDPLIFRLGV